MTSHEFDAYLDMQPLEHFDPAYHEQLTVMHEFELDRDESVRQQGAIDALKQLRNRLAFFRDAYEKHYQDDASVSNYSAMLAHQTAVETLDCELEHHQRWLQYAKGGVL